MPVLEIVAEANTCNLVPSPYCILRQEIDPVDVMKQGFFFFLMSEPPNEEEDFKKIDKVEIQLICNTPFKVSLLTFLPCDCIAIIGIRHKSQRLHYHLWLQVWGPIFKCPNNPLDPD